MTPKTRAKAQKTANPPVATGVRRSALEALALELYSVVLRALTLHGVPVARQQQLLRKTFKSTVPAGASSSLLAQFRSLSDLLTTWLEELPYIDGAGRPKVLPVKGRGATFESLARQFLPEKSLTDVVNLACETARVGIRPGGRIALYGDMLVNPVAQPEMALAHTIAHIVHIINTSHINVAAQGDPVVGRFERLVSHALNPAQFEVFNQVIRPQLNDLCARADALLRAQATQQTTDRRRAASAGIGVYVFFDDVPQPRSAGARLPRRRPGSVR